MKQIQTIIALTLLCTTANAQNIQGSYQPKADGMVSKQQVANRSESPLIYVNQRLHIKSLPERARVKEFLSTKRIGLINFEMN